ncbi:hypothetical protein HMPREF1868_00845 [Olsenella sp. DNF00959]|nr:hypothetical protein HMPREF1868_00845 [Olsenella sp. DNF00959]
MQSLQDIRSPCADAPVRGRGVGLLRAPAGPDERHRLARV